MWLEQIDQVEDVVASHQDQPEAHHRQVPSQDPGVLEDGTHEQDNAEHYEHDADDYDWGVGVPVDQLGDDDDEGEDDAEDTGENGAGLEGGAEAPGRG